MKREVKERGKGVNIMSYTYIVHNDTINQCCTIVPFLHTRVGTTKHTHIRIHIHTYAYTIHTYDTMGLFAAYLALFRICDLKPGECR